MADETAGATMVRMSTTDETREVLERALKLSRDQRAALAVGILDSLDDGAVDDPAEVERAWRDEIARRVRDIVDGKTRTVDFDEALDRIRKGLSA